MTLSKYYIIMLNDSKPSVIYTERRNRPIILSVVMLNVEAPCYWPLKRYKSSYTFRCIFTGVLKLLKAKTQRNIPLQNRTCKWTFKQSNFVKISKNQFLLFGTFWHLVTKPFTEDERRDKSAITLTLKTDLEILSPTFSFFLNLSLFLTFVLLKSIAILPWKLEINGLIFQLIHLNGDVSYSI